VVGESCRHRRRHAQRLVNPRKVVVQEMNRQREPVILNRLAKSVCQPGKAAHLHSDREIVPLRVTGANRGFVRDSKNCLFLCSGESVGAVFALSAGVPVDFDQHAVINRPCQECRLYGHKVGVVAIGAQLHAIDKPPFEVAHEFVCALGCAVANEPSRNQFRFPVNGNPGPGVAPSIPAPSVDVLGLATDETPNFVALDMLTGQAGHYPVGKSLAAFPKFNEQARYGALANSGDSHRGPDAVAFDKAGQHAATVFVGESVHLLESVRYLSALVGQVENPDCLPVTLRFVSPAALYKSVQRGHTHARFVIGWQRVRACDAKRVTLGQISKQPNCCLAQFHGIFPVLFGITVIVVFLQVGQGHHSARSLTDNVQIGDDPQAKLTYRSSCCIGLPHCGQAVFGLVSIVTFSEVVGDALAIDHDLRVAHRFGRLNNPLIVVGEVILRSFLRLSDCVELVNNIALMIEHLLLALCRPDFDLFCIHGGTIPDS